MKNQVTASVEFYYKGEKLSACVEVDLDHYLQTNGKIPALYPLLAQAIDLDFYSYEYEMMQVEPIIFSDARGLVADYVNDGKLDFDAFQSAFNQHAVIERLQAIAGEHMGIDDLQQQPELMNALLEAYQLGKAKS
jgi:hypothetical protein